MPVSTALDLDRYARATVRRSKRQYEKHGTLEDIARAALADERIWQERWLPDEIELGRGPLHPVYQSMSRAQQLAFHQLAWCLEYTNVAQGECQVVILNELAVAAYRGLLPSVVELERREAFEETDHVTAFFTLVDAVWARYAKDGSSYRVKPTSGSRWHALNRPARRALGWWADYLLGPQFPTLFFLARGIKSHAFKPVEHHIAKDPEVHRGLRRLSELHRVDEARHMATALHLSRLSNELLSRAPQENLLLFELAVEAAFPRSRTVEVRAAFWRRALSHCWIFEDIPAPERDAFADHLEQHSAESLKQLLPCQIPTARTANKRIVEQCGLSPELKRRFVRILRRDSAYAPLIDGVALA